MTKHRYLLRDKQIEDEFGIPRSTLCKLRVYGGGPPFIHIGRAVYYERDVLVQWLEQQRITSTSQRRN